MSKFITFYLRGGLYNAKRCKMTPYGNSFFAFFEKKIIEVRWPGAISGNSLKKPLFSHISRKQIFF